ncbi:GNAT family N-acetyltransferase [Breznakiella homolactica]|uniref:GNAT family N-acetyltransferase n=1 Tax=Breznakiella homolactica TaxID=2798577 RepID=A0A7T8BB47_9SPIR|nr:GNAT family N-acetyltransferase [Breznakiella homolactica]QQO08853.1 GNAT family N-acetyltransferase [Breznakiella homolactica]
MFIEAAPCRDDETLAVLAELWEASVRATHDFLNEEDIQSLKPLVREALKTISGLYLLKNAENAILGFMGAADGKIEMLFLRPDARGQGGGRALALYAVETLDARCVDVNEQNPRARGFYEHLGFKIFSRSEKDGQGRDFPILHMRME